MGNHHDGYAFLGNGWKFPIAVQEATGRMQEASYEENIKECIYLIIMTKKGERLMRPEFGCDIHQYMFHHTDYTTLTKMKHAVLEALISWEPRITDIEVNVEDSKKEENAVHITVEYRVRTTNNPFNFVFPFYLDEQ